MDEAEIIVADLVAIGVLAFGVYFPRHHRRDLVAAFLGVNIAVLAVSMTLASSTTIGIGMGLGLFGVLSIIRLRSYEISQHEIAYYFASLALGLLCGLHQTLTALAGVLMGMVVLALFIGDHPLLFQRYRQQTLRLDSAFTDEEALRAHLASLLNARVVNLMIQHVDQVNDSTLVEVRYALLPARERRARTMPTVERLAR
ncbi:MAG: DUF4956 domain-containing protein [Frankia sp.]|nr:DUF4956 domain-containing protein [Frankia sp.]